MKEFGYDPDHIGRLARQGKIDAIRSEGKWFVVRESLEQYKTQAQNNKRALAAQTIKNRGQELQLRKPITVPSFDLSRIAERIRASYLTLALFLFSIFVPLPAVIANQPTFGVNTGNVVSSTAKITTDLLGLSVVPAEILSNVATTVLNIAGEQLDNVTKITRFAIAQIASFNINLDPKFNSPEFSRVPIVENSIVEWGLAWSELEIQKGDVQLMELALKEGNLSKAFSHMVNSVDRVTKASGKILKYNFSTVGGFIKQVALIPIQPATDSVRFWSMNPESIRVTISKEKVESPQLTNAAWKFEKGEANPLFVQTGKDISSLGKNIFELSKLSLNSAATEITYLPYTLETSTQPQTYASLATPFIKSFEKIKSVFIVKPELDAEKVQALKEKVEDLQKELQQIEVSIPENKDAAIQRITTSPSSITTASSVPVSIVQRLSVLEDFLKTSRDKFQQIDSRFSVTPVVAVPINPPSNIVIQTAIGGDTVDGKTVRAQTLTVSDSGTITSNLTVGGYASASQFFGSGLSDCDDGTHTLNWDSSTGKFSCGTDAGAGSAEIKTEKSGTSVLATTTTLNFDDGKFTLTASGSTETIINFDWGSGGPASLSQNETITGAWTFPSFSSSANFEAVGFASASKYFGSAFAGLTGTDGCNGASDTLNYNSTTGTFSCGSDGGGGGGVSSNSLDFDEFVSAMTVDVDTTITAGTKALTFDHASTSGDFEVGGNIIFHGEIMPDGVTCSNGQILKKTGADDWDCAADDDVPDAADYTNLTGGLAIDNNSGTLDFDPVELINNRTWSTGAADASIVWTWDLSAGTDPTLTFSNNRIGIGGSASVSVNFEVTSGFASISGEFNTKGGLEVAKGTAADVAYSRFGINSAGNALITTADDLLISGDFELDGKAFFDGTASVSGNFEVGSSVFTVRGNVVSFGVAASHSITGDLDLTDDLSFSGELLPDGSLCSNSQILKKTGADDWDCAADAGLLAASNEVVTGFWEFTNGASFSAGSNGLLVDLNSTGDFIVRRGATNYLTVTDAGVLTFDNITLDGNTIGTTSGGLTIDSAGALTVSDAASFSSTVSVSGTFEGAGTIKATTFAADAGITVNSGGANTITIDTGGSSTITIGGTSATGVTVGRSGQTVTLAGNVGAFTLTGNITGSGSPNITALNNASGSGAFEAPTIKTTTITNDGVSLITISPPALFSSSASVSTNFEVVGYASISRIFGGNASHSFTGDLHIGDDLSFNGEILPDGALCSNGQILKKAGANDWDCANDDTAAGGGIATIELDDSVIDNTVTILDFLGTDFLVTESPEDEINIAIDYTDSGITRKTQNETITGFWTFGNNASISNGFNFEVTGYASASRVFGAGLTDCDGQGEKLVWTASGSNAGRFGCGSDGASVEIRKLGDEASPLNSTALQDDNELFFWMGTNETWVVQINYVYTTNSVATNDIAVGLNAGAAGTSCVYSAIDIAHAGNASAAALACNTSITLATTATGNKGGLVSGTITTGGNIASATFRWAQGTADAANATTVKAGSSMLGYKVTGADLAEVYYTNATGLLPGTLVSIDPNLNSRVQQSTMTYDKNLLGIVSTKPGVVIGDADEIGGGIPVIIALAGRVPVQVSTENGAIRTGDFLTSSSIPGVAMKAAKAGPVIGQALNNYDGDGIGVVAVFVKPTYFGGESFAKIFPEGTDGDLASDFNIRILERLVADSNNLTSESLSEIFTDRVIAGLEVITPRLIADTVLANKFEPIETDMEFLGNAFFTGALTVQNIEIGSSDKPSGITLYDLLTGTPYCSRVENGSFVTSPGKCSSLLPTTLLNTLPIPEHAPPEGTSMSSDSSESTATPLPSVTPAGSSNEPSLGQDGQEPPPESPSPTPEESPPEPTQELPPPV